MSRRNYNAFIKAARRTGGLSLPSARKAARKLAAKLGRTVKGTDVKKHPKLFRAALAKRDRDKLKRESKRSSKTVSRKVLRREVPGRKKATSAKRVSRPEISVAAPRVETPHIETPKPIEYAASTDYKRLRVQVHVRSNAPMTQREISRAVTNWVNYGIMPRGVKVSAIEWRNGPKGKWVERKNEGDIRKAARDLARVGLQF